MSSARHAGREIVDGSGDQVRAAHEERALPASMGAVSMPAR